ncbi:MAG: ABC transporter ATP-binding protein [Burkholderiaceae bacterium]
MSDSVSANAAPAPVLDVRGLKIRLPEGGDRRYAVNDVGFSVGPGEIVCLVGESGSGKSVISFSVMGLLAKALKIESGRIALQGEDLAGASEERLRALRCTRMGMIFQEPMTALNPVMRCGAQLDEVLREHTRLNAAQRREKILEMIRQVHLPDPERMYASFPHQLSGGQRQRIMIAMALILEPALLIADEPTTALDVTTQAQILKLIKELQLTKGTGVLFITHDFGVVAEIADRVAVLKHGELVEVGTTAEVLRNPRHAYTKMLIDAVPGHEPPTRDEQAAAAEPIVLKTVDLAKTYTTVSLLGGKRTVDAARDVNLEIRRGQTLGIVGESGSGKSTVARCIARLIDPSEGRVLLSGADIAQVRSNRLHQMRRRVQVIFQDPYRSLSPRRTVGDSIIEGPMNYGVSRDDALVRARKLLGILRLEESALARYPHEFSGGQRQRICIARALAMEPELLIADEAVSALDVSVQAQVLQLLEEIRHSLNLAVLFITHDLRVAAQVCDQVAVMSKGRVVEYGSAHQIFTAPRHEYTRALFDAAPGRDFEFARTSAPA